MATKIKKEIKLEIGHVLFMDVVGYSKLLINEQRAARETLNQIVRQTEKFQEADAAGTLIKSPSGDGMALVFHGSPEDPVECALEISRALKAHPDLPLRMGIHSGPVSGIVDVNDTTSVAGAGINMAQRVMDCGDAGHILVSKHLADDLEQYANWQPYLHDLGVCEVKHGVRLGVTNLYSDAVGNPQLPKKFQAVKKHRGHVRWAQSTIALLVVSAVVAAFVLVSRRPVQSIMAAPEKSIAVLPFENRSGDPANAYFAEGVQDEILTRLSKIADLKVSSRASTQNYKSAPRDLSEIGRQLGVAHVLEGSVQRSGDAVRVNVQLIKVANDSHLWADTLDRKLTDIFSVESEVAKAIADQLRVKITGQEEKVIGAKPTQSVEAYDAYLRGLAYTLKAATTPSTILGAQKHLREAVRLDPNFAVAWALLSYTDSVAYIEVLQPTIAVREEARHAAETALALQPNLGEALYANGYYYYACLKDYDTAVRYFGQAHQSMPNSSQFPESLAYVTRRRGEWQRSESYFKEAERLDPRHVNMLTEYATSCIDLRHFPEALRKLDQVLGITPGDLDTLARKAAIAQGEGDLPRASELLAPLRPNAEDTQALETQVYQAILERRPAQIIPRLEEILAKPDPALGYLNGELRFWLGWAQEVAGDHAAAQETWRQARSELESFLKEQPENYKLIGDLALINAGLGDKAAALALSDQAMAVIPVAKDAVSGPAPIEILARVAAQMAEPNRAIAALQKLLAIPYESAQASGVPLTPALLRLDPMFDPLRGDPRFEELAALDPPKDAKP
jgi:TolB-like protein/Tfp pilus assembly protein PilF